MSSKGRTKAGAPAEPGPEKDNYPTPVWAIRAILAALWPDLADPRTRRPGPLRVLDPCVGDGGFLLEIARLTQDRPELRPEMVGIDIRPEAVRVCQEEIAKTGGTGTLLASDFLGERAEWPLDLGAGDFDLVMSNPPYGPRHSDLATAFVKESLEWVRPGGSVVMLLRLNWASDGESEFGRGSWLRAGNMPDQNVLDRRPSFVNGGTDSCGYAAFRWVRGRRSDEATWRIIRCDRPYVSGVLSTIGFRIEHFRPDDWRKEGRKRQPEQISP